ncbi:MAG: hypothetical protein IIV55_04980 [Alistipes sp.]|nr:hypothetical protein [Alistipes sp.]
MRFVTLLILTLALSCGLCQAQSLKFGDELPRLDVNSSVNLRKIDKQYTCLVFMHSKSDLSLEAISEFRSASRDFVDSMAIVFITPEDSLDRRILEDADIVAFDNNGRTFANFGVRFVPFAVVYKTRGRVVMWFGPLAQLDQKTFNEFNRL